MTTLDKEVQEINRLVDALHNTDSKYLKRDYSLSISRKVAALREYCSYQNIDFNSLGVKAPSCPLNRHQKKRW